MKSLHLKTNTEQEFKQACIDAGLVSEEGDIITASHDHALDIIGTLYKPSGNMLTDEDGNEYPERIKLDGYHVNLKTKKQLGIEHLAVNVKTPLIKWSGK